MKTFLVLILAFDWGIAQSAQVLPLLAQNSDQTKLPLPDRVERLEKRVSNKTFLNMFSQIYQLETEVKQLHGEIERLTHELEGIKKRQRGLYLDLDQRLLQLEGTDSAGTSSEYSPLTAPPKQQTPEPKQEIESKPAAATAEEIKAYAKAYRTLQDGGFVSAIDLFKAFVEKYPQGEYIDNAEYWLAEAYYVRREFKLARQGFDRVLNQHPESPKAKDALLKIGFIEYEEKNWNKAKQVLKDVTKRYRNSTVARLAQERLHRMRKDGH